MSTAVTYHWMPFAGDCFHPRRFQVNRWYLPRVVDRGLAAFRDALGDKLFAQEYTHHPLGLDYAWLGNRWRIIEAGVMLAELPSFGDYPKRLRHPDAYMGACTELQGGLYLRRMGFEVQRDPVNAGRASGQEAPESGPDWLARFRACTFGVEVKCPLRSDEVIGHERLQSTIFFAMQRFLPPGFAGLDVRVDPTIMPVLVQGRTVMNEPFVEKLVLEALLGLEADGQATTRLGSFQRSSTNMTSIRIPPPDATREVSRIRDLLYKAATQLDQVPHPGIVMLDATYDRTLPFRCCDIAEILREPHWSSIAVVMATVPTLPGAVVTLIPGRRYKDFEPCLRLPGLRLCRRGHLHVATLAPPPDCSDVESYAACPDCFDHLSRRRR